MNNIYNKVINKEIIENIINKYTKKEKIRINSIYSYQKAFIHKSVCIINYNNNICDNYSCFFLDESILNNNERLEFLGDKVIDLITTEFLFDKYPNKDEGFLTKLKSRIVRKEGLSFLSEKIGFKEYILISSHIERISGRNNTRFLEDIFESFMGALYKDQNSNLEICKNFLLGVYDEFLNLEELINNNVNYKDSLLRYFHHQKWSNPIYTNIHTIEGSVQQNKIFVIIVMLKKELISNNEAEFIKSKQRNILKKLDNEVRLSEKNSNDIYENIDLKTYYIIGVGKGSTKKIAEQDCSKSCLINLDISLNY